MQIYITPAGKTALLIGNFLDRPKEEFGFDLAVMLSDSAYTEKLYEQYSTENILIIPISNPYFGVVDYLPTVRRLVKQTLIFGASPDNIIINSSGGTEKMTNIIKDAGDILAVKYSIKRVFGVYDRNTKDVVFTTKPQFDPQQEFGTIAEEVKTILELKEKLYGASNMDLN